MSRYGLVAFASSLDHIGPFCAHRARRGDAARSHRRPRPARTPLRPKRRFPTTPPALDGNVKGLRIGVPKEYFQGLDAQDGRRIQRRPRAALKNLGCEIATISLPHTDYAIACYYIICTAEASSNLARYDGVRYTSRARSKSETLSRYVPQNTRGEGFGAEVQAPHHAGNLRAERRLLRCLLSEGAESARADRRATSPRRLQRWMPS